MKKIICILLISFQAKSADFTVEFTPANNSISNNSIISILSSKISDLSSSVMSILSSNKVIFRGTSSVGTLLTYNVHVNVPFVATKDTHSAWNGTAFIVPSGQGGVYRVSTFLMTNTYVGDIGGTVNCRIYKNGIAGDLLAMNRSVTQYTKYFELSGTDVIEAQPGDSIEVRVYQTILNGTVLLLNAAEYNHLSIVKEN